MSTAINGFRKCGIWPYNQNNFTDADFISAETTNIQNIADSSKVEQQGVSEAEGLQSGTVPCLSLTTTVTTVSSTATISSHTETLATLPEATTTSSTPLRTELIAECYEALTPTVVKTPVLEPEPGCSYSPKPAIRAACRDLTSSFENASPSDILPIPSVQRTKNRKQYRRGKTAIITSTPYKNELENLKKPGKTSNPNDPRLKRNAKNKQKTKQSDKTQKCNDEDVICLYCNDVNHSFLTSLEPWVACQLCGRWAHNACAGVDNEDLEEIHICLFCENN
ncbi:unnamed protein product [Parnassius apollo]|uniref:(apollo) hypothetical protein n=1 Tax=Parnassius apollo TaxID=110799 RepID=A0A8S3XZY2_PARAO|nr:unnamed protein product [Parnassius apollo]